MRLNLSFLLFTFLFVQCNSKPEQLATLIHLPITVKPGYGPFYPSFGLLSAEHIGDPLWGETYLPVQGLPKTWSHLTKSMIWLNAHQLVYQQAKQGNITPANYQYLQKSWKWTPDSTEFCATPIKCYVYAITGFDEQRQQWAVMVDTNNNLDFKDERPVYPELIKPGSIPDQVQHPQIIHYQVYREKSVLSVRAPMVVKMMNDQFLYNFPQYATATFKTKEKTYQLLVSPSFSRLDYESAEIALPTAIKSSGKIDPQQLVAVGENIVIDHITYKYKGIDGFHNWLELAPLEPNTHKEYSLQVGYPFRPLKINDFTTGKAVTLGGKREKYLFVDFWGTWCKGCVEEIPHLKTLYQEIDKTKIDFVGIACHDSPERLKAFLVKEHLMWPQLLSDTSNSLVDQYEVSGFPTSVLINPEGIVVAKNLPTHALKDKLKELIK